MGVLILDLNVIKQHEKKKRNQFQFFFHHIFLIFLTSHFNETEKKFFFSFEILSKQFEILINTETKESDKISYSTPETGMQKQDIAKKINVKIKLIFKC